MSPKKILVVEDDNSTRQLLKLLLQKNYHVECSEDGFEAMLYLSNGNIPDLILLDVSMPNISGMSFLKNIRQSGFFKDIPIIILSGIETVAELNAVKKLSIQGFLKKPFRPTELYQKINEVFDPIEADMHHVG